MFDKIQILEKRYAELTEMLGDPSVVSDRGKFRELSKEHSDLAPIIVCADNLKKTEAALEVNKELLRETDDVELRELAQEEQSGLRLQIENLQKELIEYLLPKDPNDEKNTIIEIRAGTGGDEAGLFAGELFQAFAKYAEKRRWKVEILSVSDATVGGYKEVIFQIIGKGAFSAFKYESGVHRVQRVPKTETQGRIHTSTITVAVLPEAEEADVELLDKDLRIDVFRSSGPGGQSVNTTDSAVRVTHIPSGLVVTCQDEKSQIKNKAKALKVLRARLLNQKQEALDAERRDNRKSQIGTGSRSERIRTYNFPQGRVTDHRIGLTLYQVDLVMAGDLDLVIVPLQDYAREEALRAETGQPAKAPTKAADDSDED
ncbi:peptide chain release factor 1 [bacterium]|nr:peptide chain release factor 1 [bacterium]